ncbi:SMP-30/gluconolactonase/LRE family protein [Sphingomonas ginkgonis]|uniref:SMP-30/gluconolactonase/LRE family protein n=1 Tax=Sphingomonas ginkgonis TaxID=2315330 RepID=A0A3R9YP20_9SPHN|nr:SMP-30/gluconolactonase/LRE family protein [Sphingomonas ginkgonis]RST32121.1 SMP-30/gluconolactonase/LRE family protein [Sphingomonas ginkgonis]
MSAEPVSVWPLGAELGEGPVWLGDERTLGFVDIKKQQVHFYSPDTGERRSWAAPEPIGFLLPARGGGFVAGLQSGLHRFDERTGAFAPLAPVETHLPGNRLNDACVDPAGRLWFGSMDNGEREPSGAFYCLDESAVRPAGLPPVCITNGPAVSADGRRLYHVDTLGGTIDVAELRPDGSLGEPRPFVRIDPADGYPDGPTIDSEDHLWIGLYGGWEARRYSPAGEMVQRVRFPVANVTKLAFGGNDLRTVFATTARQFLSEEQLAEQPQAGDLFQFRVNVPGVPCSLVQL